MEDKTNSINRLKENILLQAEYFLNDIQEFFPFASVITSTGVVKPTNVYFGEEYPDPNKVIDELRKGLSTGLQRGDCQMVAIGIDVFLPAQENDERQSAVEIRIMDINGLIVKYRVPYHFNELKKVIFEELLTVNE